jgi:hypothetical protein
LAERVSVDKGDAEDIVLRHSLEEYPWPLDIVQKTKLLVTIAQMP